MNSEKNEYTLLDGNNYENISSIPNNLDSVTDKMENLEKGAETRIEIEKNGNNKTEFRKEDDKYITECIGKTYYNEEKKTLFLKYFYSNGENEELLSNEFISVGVFEDIKYFPWWTCIDEHVKTTKILSSEYAISYWRKIKGDGNCYYRAVLINYLENLIIKSTIEDNPVIFLSLIKDLYCTEFQKELEKYKTNTLTVLCAIYDNILNKNPSKCFDILYRGYNKSDIIEKTLIQWIRNKLTLFLKANLDLEFNGIKLVQLIPGFELDDDMTYNKNTVLKYIDQELLKMDEFVEGYPIYITPLILKMKINIFYIDSNYNPIAIDLECCENINNSIIPIENYLYDCTKDGEDINILFRIPHYDTVYKSEFVDNVKSLYNNKHCFINTEDMNADDYMEYKSQVVVNTNIANRKRNPLSQLLNGDKVDNINSTYNQKLNNSTTIVIDVKNINYEDINNTRCINTKANNNNESYKNTNNKDTDIKEVFDICIVCYKTNNQLLYYPCRHCFCIPCFEIEFNKFINYGQKSQKWKLRDMTSTMIINSLKNIKKFKFVKCLAQDDCYGKFNFDEIQDILDGFYAKIKKGGNNKEKLNNEGKRNYTNNSSNNNDNTGNKNNTKDEKFCKCCRVYKEHILLTHGCEVCSECQREKIYKQNKVKKPIAVDTKGEMRKNTCILCDKDLLMDDYEVLFSKEQIENSFD